MKDSAIEWTDHTFNPWIVCTKVSPGCANCYAEALNVRWHKGENWGKGAKRVRTSAQYWKQPLRWNEEAARRHIRPRVFCASLADWLDDEVPIEWLADLLKLIHDTPNLDWLLLTKRPQNYQRRMTQAGGFMFNHAWIGVTVEDQQRAEERIPELLKIPARVRFLSCEPLLEEVDLCHANGLLPIGDTFVQNVDWVICGGESGSKRRLFAAAWARLLRDQCQETCTPFFMKQMDKVRAIPTDLMVREFPIAK